MATVRGRAGRPPRRLRGVPRRPLLSVRTAGDLTGHARGPRTRRVSRCIVDAAWAAHLGFHPGLPPHALAAGADAMVTSAHKALPAYTQGALVLARTGETAGFRRTGWTARSRPPTPPARRARSSPASTLHARCWPATGPRCARGCCAWSPTPVGGCARVPGLGVLDGPGVEPTKLVVLLAGTGAHGVAIEADLIAAGNVGRDGRPGHDRADRHPGRRRGGGGPLHRDAGGSGAAAPGRATAAGPLAGLAIRPQVAIPPARHFSCATDGRPPRRRGAGLGRAGGALPAGCPGARPRRGDHGGGARRAARDPGRGGRIAYAADPSLATFQVVAQD